jgi:hypothetical protein
VTYLAVVNPGDSPAEVTFTYMLAGGTIAGHSRFTIDIADEVGRGQDVSTRVSCGQPLIAERPMYFARPSNGIRVCIDAGHSGHDGSEIDPATGLNVGDNTGAPGELQDNWVLARALTSRLQEAGYEVQVTRQDVNGYLSLRQRAEVGNTCAIMVRLHHDPSGFTGVMRPPPNAARCPQSDPSRITVVDAGVAGSSDRLARCIASSSGLPVRDDTGGTSQGNATPPGHATCLIGSLLSKVSIVTIENRYDSSDAYVMGILKGIDAYFGSD